MKIRFNRIEFKMVRNHRALLQRQYETAFIFRDTENIVVFQWIYVVDNLIWLHTSRIPHENRIRNGWF